MPNGSSWSAPNSPKFSARSSVASAVPTVSYRWSPPTTTTNAVWLPPLPLLFQRRVGSEQRALSASAIRSMLDDAITATGLTEPATGQPLRFTPHDFRRLFITDAVLNGLPPHIAQVIAGHRDINVTMGYKAVYPDEAIQSHLAFLARRRELRPTDEYRAPTDEEWQEFLGHFERRKVSTRHLRAGVRQQLCSRTRLRQMPTPLARSHPTAPTARDPRQPDRPHRRSPTRGLARRGRRTPSQPRRRRRQTRSTQPAQQPNQHRPISESPRSQPIPEHQLEARQGRPFSSENTGSTRSSAARASRVPTRRAVWRVRSAASGGATSSRSPRSPRWPRSTS